MTNSHEPITSLYWYLQTFGLPLAVGISIYKLYQHFMQYKVQLQNKVVVITGASSGVGEALAHCFYRHKCKVVLAARRESELKRVKEDLLALKLSNASEPEVICLDLGDYSSIEKFYQQVQNVCGHVDILINNGGISNRGSVLETKLEVFKQIMEINYFGSVALTKFMVEDMQARKTGHIVFVSSVQGRIAIPYRSAYAASKHALQAFADSLRAEVDKNGIKVSVISPGYIQTALSLNALTGSGKQYGVMDATTAAGDKPEIIATRILKMTLNSENDVIFSSIKPKVAIFLRYFLPSLYFYMMKKRANKGDS